MADQEEIPAPLLLQTLTGIGTKARVEVKARLGGVREVHKALVDEGLQHHCPLLSIWQLPDTLGLLHPESTPKDTEL
jgi:hypothetical protein